MDIVGNEVLTNQTINEGPIANESTVEENQLLPPEPSTEGSLTWEPITVIAIMVLLLLINFMHLVKKPAIPKAPPEEMLMMSSGMDSVFDQTDKVLENNPIISDPIEEEKQSQIEIQGTEAVQETPPINIENTIQKEGFEWVEWPTGSGQSFYRPENTGGEWRKWPVE